MNFTSVKLYDLSKVLFADGWFFFVPYLFFYLVFKYFHLRISNLENIFFVFHILNSILFVHYLYKSYNKNYLSKLLFWLGIILLFQISGAYIEFPSDAWEHFRRIFEWQACSLIEHHSANSKFTYFWGWTLMSEVEPLYRRTVLDLYSTFWQFLLAYQFYLFALRIGFSDSWAKIQVVGTIGLFGTNVFSFYRYYALSSTLLAYIAYLRAVIVILDIFNGKRRKAIELIFLLPLIYYNHHQELLLLSISSLAIYIAQLYDNKRAETRKKITYRITLILISGLLLGALAITIFQESTLLISNSLIVYLQDFLKEKKNYSLIIDSNYWSTWGMLRIWDQKLPYFQTLGIYGYLSIILSVLFWNKYRLLSTLTFLPLLLLLFQPFTLLIASLEDHYTTFRVLYSLPYSFILILGIREILRFAERINTKYLINNYFFIVLLLSILSFQPNLPWRGRLWHQLYKPPVQLTLKNLDVTAQWFFKNRQIGEQYMNAQWFFENPKADSQCLLVSDNSTSFSLATHLGLIPPYKRLSPYNPSQSLNTLNSLKEYLRSETQQKPCSFLVGIPAQIKPIPFSKVGKISGHWIPDIVRQNLNYSQEFLEATDFLTTLGWTKTFVPPFYWLYEAPSTE